MGRLFESGAGEFMIGGGGSKSLSCLLCDNEARIDDKVDEASSSKTFASLITLAGFLFLALLKAWLYFVTGLYLLEL